MSFHAVSFCFVGETAWKFNPNRKFKTKFLIIPGVKLFQGHKSEGSYPGDDKRMDELVEAEEVLGFGLGLKLLNSFWDLTFSKFVHKNSN
mgnify:CR=1 FL=1